LPGSWERYVEPFCGGAALFFDLDLEGPKKPVLADINADLIAAYTYVRDHCADVTERLRDFAALHSKEQFYTERTAFNTPGEYLGVERAAAMIYLSRACFNGIWRTSLKGDFNTPVGDREVIDVDADGLRSVSHALRNTELLCLGFKDVLARCGAGDFVYLDPPYVPISKTANFTTYSRGGFGLREHALLADAYRAASERGAALMLSGADTWHAEELYGGFTLDRVSAQRSVGASAATRVKAAEVIITNYGRNVAAASNVR
jgi:DNA adenine methylase